jgi:hypothetical protein
LVELIDTAGIRKPKARRETRLIMTIRIVGTVFFIIMMQRHYVVSNHDHDDQVNLACIEDMAVAESMRAFKIADVVVLVTDAFANNLPQHELAISQQIKWIY